MSIMLRLLKLLHAERGWMVLGVMLGTLTVLANIALMAVSGWFIAAMGIAGVAGAMLNYFTPAAIIRGLAITRTAGRYGERLLTHDATLRVTARLRVWLYGHIERLPPLTLTGLHSGDLFGRLRSDIDQLEKFYLGMLVPLGVAALSMIGIAIGLALVAPALLPWMLLALLLVGVALPLWLQRASQTMQVEISQQSTLLRAKLAETWQGAAELMVYGAAPAAITVIDDITHRIDIARRRQQLLAMIAQALSQLIMQSVAVGALAVMAQAILMRQIDAADIAMLPLLCMACFDAVLPLAAALQNWHGMKMAALRVFALVDQAQIAPENVQTVPHDDFILQIDRPVFGYGETVLRGDIDLQLRAGETLAIVGPSGIGKSTLVGLLAGLWLPTGGDIRLNGVSVAACDPDQWRGFFSVAEQRPHIFTGTIRQNLLVAHPAATMDDIDSACQLAGLQDDIAQLPVGLDTMLGEHGLGLSGGQIRRLSIARALLKPCRCLILDEPTDSLDAAFASAMMQRILADTAARQMAVIVVTHSAAIAALCGKTLRL